MEIESLHNYMSELLSRVRYMCKDDNINNPYDAIDALTNLMNVNGYDTRISDLIDEISYTMDDIDSMSNQTNLGDGDKLFEDDEEMVGDPVSNDEINKRRQRFITYGVKKVNDTITSINKLQRLAETTNYVVTPEEKKKIIDLLQAAVKELESVYSGEKKSPNLFSITESNLKHIIRKIVIESIR